jgi:hypothetical protein
MVSFQQHALILYDDNAMLVHTEKFILFSPKLVKQKIECA